MRRAIKATTGGTSRSAGFTNGFFGPQVIDEVIVGWVICYLEITWDKGATMKYYLTGSRPPPKRALPLSNTLLANSPHTVMNPRPLELNASLQKTEKFLARLIGE